MIAELVREAIARGRRPTCSMPRLTASIGMATYPDHAHDARSLLVTSLSALERAQTRGPNQAAEAEPAALKSGV